MVPRKGKSHDQSQTLILFYSRILIERLCVNYVNRVYIIYMHHEVCIKSTAGGGFCKTSDVKRLRSSERWLVRRAGISKFCQKFKQQVRNFTRKLVNSFLAKQTRAKETGLQTPNDHSNGGVDSILPGHSKGQLMRSCRFAQPCSTGERVWMNGARRLPPPIQVRTGINRPCFHLFWLRLATPSEVKYIYKIKQHS